MEPGGPATECIAEELKDIEGLFTIEDVKTAIESTNFNKAMGTDGFDGSVLKNDTEVQSGIASWILNSLNNGTIP
jgi:hypothetical protein